MHINWLKIKICVLGCMLRSHARNENECKTPCHGHSAANIVIPGFYILVIQNSSEIHESWHVIMERHQHAVPIFCPICGRFGYMLLTNQSFSQQALWFSVGNVPSLGMKQYPLSLIAFKKFLVST